MKKALVALTLLVTASISCLIANYHFYVLPIRRGLANLYPGFCINANPRRFVFFENLKQAIPKKRHKYIKVERS